MSSLRIATVAALLLSVSSQLEAQDKRRCADTPIDSTNPSAPLYRDCHVERKARPRGSAPRMDFTPSPSGPSCYRAAFEFVVDTAGKPELATVRRVSTTDETFGRAAESIISGLVFEPARLGGIPVRQVTKYESSAAISRVVVSSVGGRPSASTAPRRPLC